jgi:hypothetical protein
MLIDFRSTAVRFNREAFHGILKARSPTSHRSVKISRGTICCVASLRVGPHQRESAI